MEQVNFDFVAMFDVGVEHCIVVRTAHKVNGVIYSSNVYADSLHETEDREAVLVTCVNQATQAVDLAVRMSTEKRIL